jgi:cell division protein YceG involved in septum cleavage
MYTELGRSQLQVQQGTQSSEIGKELDEENWQKQKSLTKNWQGGNGGGN